MAKILGTIICVGGAFCMAFSKGGKLLSTEFRPSKEILDSLGDEWIAGCLFLMASTCCWSLWLILQVSSCLDPLSLSVWMCFLATLQSAIFIIIFKPGLDAWKITSYIELFACLFAGIFGSGVTFSLQAWSVSARGPLFSALFNPLSTIITNILSVLFLHEVLHLGSLVGAFVAVVGLYIVLWGKAKDQTTGSTTIPSMSDDSVEAPLSVLAPLVTDKPDIKKPLLLERSDDDESLVNTEP